MIRMIAFYTDSAGFGGAEQVLLTLLAGLDRRRWRPVLIHHAEAGLAPLLEQAHSLGTELQVALPMPEGYCGAGRVPQFVARLRALDPAVFHAHLTWPRACKYGLAAAVIARVPAIVATEHLFVDLPVSRSIYLQQRLIAAGVDRYIAVSGEVARQLRKAFGIPASKLQVVHNGICVAAFDRRPDLALRAQLGVSPEHKLIFTAARLDSQKGHACLLEAARRIPEAIFALAGGGPDRAKLEGLARQLGIDDRVLFLGYRNDVPDLLAACDLFVLPSLYEGLPLSVLEAMAAGKPVIASAIGGTNEAVIDGVTGLLVPPGAPDALAHAIQRILHDPALAQSMASAGKQRVHQDFSAETMVQRVVQIYDELLEGHEARHDGD